MPQRRHSISTVAGRRSRLAGLGSLAAGIALALVLTACSGDDPDSDQASKNGAASGGAALYEAKCASCHGVDLRGTDRGPSQLSVVYEPSHHSDESYRSAVAIGVRAHHWAFGDMPPVGGLSDDQVDQIIGYIRAQQRTHGFEPYPPE